MKTVTLLVLATAVFVTAELSPRDGIIFALSRAFKINILDVEKCMNKTGALAEDFMSLELLINDDDSAENHEGVAKRASCALVCCAHLQGSMVNGKVNVPYINKFINELEMPPLAKSVFVLTVHRCNEKVKNISDKCDLGYAFLKCMIDNTRHIGM